MTDTITPASLRAHADWFAGRWHLVSEALIDEAARLEAESARDGEAEKLAEDLAFAYCLGFGHDADEFKWNPGGRGHDAWLAVARQVLVLAADGRLLPEGEDRTVYDDTTLERVYRGLAAAGIELRQAVDVVNQIQNQGILFRQSPDDDYDTPPAVSVPDSGPDGTPEKPWPTAADVPDGVVYRGARDTSGWDGWFNRGGARHRFFDGAPSKTSDDMVDDEAPFVRVDGDKA